jgi:murein tripeptide amidase MpaA
MSEVTIHIDAAVPSGRIEVIDAHNPKDIRLAVPKDPNSDLMGWYHFRASGVRGVACRYSLVNAGEIAGVRLPNRGKQGFEDRWTNTGPLASYDLERWFRIPATYDGEVFSFAHQADSDVCHYAAFAPYPIERDQRFIATALRSPRVRLKTIGHSVQGRPIDLLTIGSEAAGKKKCWLIARQHPSETQGGFFLEGLLARLLDDGDAQACALLNEAVVYIVPNLNPDGSANGYSRTNALGVNLNREWQAPSQAHSPEILCVQQAMDSLGLDFCMDCHADAELNFNFVWPSENVPSWTSERQAAFKRFEMAWSEASPDYGVGEAYPGGVPAQADLSMGWNWIGERFPASLSVLLEQPFKDNRGSAQAPDGWTPQRATNFGATFLSGLLGVVGTLGASGPTTA